MKNVFYMNTISSIGGCESFFYYLSKVYKDFVVMYKQGDPEQIKRLSKNIEVRKYKDKIVCDNFFCNYNFDVDVEAKNYYHIIHYDALNVKFTPMQKEDFKYIGVSKVACDSLKAVTGRECELIYNEVPVKPKGLKKNKGLNLISCTRLTLEKGLDRIVKLSNALDKAGVEYTWTIYTNRTLKARTSIISPNVIVKEQQLDLYDEIEKSSYLVQLSDCESFGLSVCESLLLGTPVIITDIPAFREIGCTPENAVFIDLEMKTIPIEEILAGKKKVVYSAPKSAWSKYLKKTSDYNPEDLIEVVAKKRYFDIDLQENIKRGQVYKVKKCRASYLESRDLVDICD